MPKWIRLAPLPSSFSLELFRRELLRWFRKERRDLPWRHTRDPYRIWVSEIMLQQTQVGTALPYYRRFLRKFPKVSVLAKASLEEVFAAWAGLGYYTRARNLHRAAGMIVDRFGGRLPETHEELLSLPGIGRYTAGAVLSIAFGQRYPVVDGNVERVLARLMALRGNVKSSDHQSRLWSWAEQMVPPRAPSDFNQGLMELGATLCLPRQPQCGRCPVKVMCRAYRLHVEDRIPEIKRNTAVQRIHRLVAVIRNRDSRILLWRRRGETLMRDFWEFPQTDLAAGDFQKYAAVRDYPPLLEKNLGRRFQGRVHVVRLLGDFQHTITFRHIHVHIFEARVRDEAFRCLDPDLPCRWVRANNMDKYLFDSASLRILAAIRK